MRSHTENSARGIDNAESISISTSICDQEIHDLNDDIVEAANSRADVRIMT